VKKLEYFFKINKQVKEVWVVGRDSRQVSKFVYELFLKLYDISLPRNWQDKIKFAQEKVIKMSYNLDPRSGEYRRIE